MSENIIEHRGGKIIISELGENRRKIQVLLHDGSSPMKHDWITSYPIDLITHILKIKGPNALCDELMRDEDPFYVQRDLELSLLSYVEKSFFKDKRILDFGCGCGSSTVVLGRMFPDAEIVAVELEKSDLDVARERAGFYQMEKVTFVHSPDGDKIPDLSGVFDSVVLSAVYEHLLPSERGPLLETLWKLLKPGGVLFINQTPDRRFPIETHTTGFPFLNYLPDKIVHKIACRFSRRLNRDATWEQLLRWGIRGGTLKEINSLMIDRNCEEFSFLSPIRDGIRRQSDIWYVSSKERLGRRWDGWRTRVVVFFVKSIQLLRIPVSPYLNVAIKKTLSQEFIPSIRSE